MGKSRTTAWPAAIADFTAWTMAGGGSRRSLRIRRHYLSHLALACPDPWAVTLDDLLTFLSRPDWKPETRKSARGAVRAFYRWAETTGRLATDPARGLPPVRIPAGVPRPASAAAVSSAMAAGADRERLMLLLGAFAGLRCEEIAKARTDDLTDGVLYVLGKGGKSRQVPLPQPLADLIAAQPPGYLFPGREDGHLSPSHVSKLLKRLLGPQSSAHKLRHRFASAAYASTRDLFAVQKLLGHAKPETTAIYVLVPAESLRAAVEGAAVGLDQLLLNTTV